MQNNFILNKLPEYLIILLPFFLITGPFLSDLSVVILSIIFLIKIFKNKDYVFFKNRFFYFFILFYFYLLINSLINNQNIDSLRISISYIRFPLFSLAIMFFLQKDPNLLKKIFYSLLISFIILTLDSLIQFFFGKNILGWELIYPGPRVSSFFGNELILGSYISRFFPLLIGLLIFFKSNNLILAFILFSSTLMVFFSGERTAIFLLFLSLILIFFLISENRNYFRKYIYLILLTSFLILTFSKTIKTRVIDVTFDQMFSNKNSKNVIFILTKQHEEHYLSSFKMFKKNPILGVGVKNFRVFCKNKEFNFSSLTCSPHPHNTYIQIAAETGIIGLIFILIIFIYLNYIFFLHYFLNFKNKKTFSDFQILCLISFYLTLWPLIPSGNFFNNWLSIIYFYPVGIFLWSVDNKIVKNYILKN